MTRRGFLGASAALAAGLNAGPARAWLMAPMLPAWSTSAPPVPGLGYLTALAVAPSDTSTLLAGGDVHGLKRTTDAGVLWGQMDRGTWKAGRYGIAAITPHPTAAGTYYALSGADNSEGAVYITTDSGGSWTLLATGIATEPQTGDQNGTPVLRVYGRLLALEPHTGGDILYAASYRDGLFKSTTGGGSWTNRGLAGMNLTAVVLLPGSPSTVYVGWRADTNNWSDQTGGIKVSHDAGGTWSDLLTGVPVRDLVVDPNQTESIYVAALTGGVTFTHDSGRTWKKFTSGLPMRTPAGGPTYFNTIAVNPNPGRTGEVLVGTGEGNVLATSGSVYRSQDGGATWTDLVTGSNVHPDSTVATPAFYDLGGNGYAASAVVVPVGQPNTIWVAGRSLVWFSTDGGQSWHPSSAGLEGAGHHHDVGIDPTTGAITMGTGDWAVVQSDPTRQTWTISSLPYPGETGNNRALSFAFTTRRLLLGSGSKQLSEGNFGGVYVWDPVGKSWNQTGAGLTPGRVVGLATAPSNPDVVYAAVAQHGVFKSTDGGTSFSLMPMAGFDTGALFPEFFTKVPIAVHPHDPSTVYVLDHVMGLYAFSPATARWTNISGGVSTAGKAVVSGQPYQGFALDATQPSRLYVASPAGLWRSANAGSNWARVAIANTEGFGPVVVDPGTGTVFACTALAGESSALTDHPGIYVGTNGGTSWAGGFVDGRFAVDFEVLVSDPTAANTVWAGSAGSLFSLGPAS